MSEIIVTQIIRNYHDKNSVDRIYNNLNLILSNKISLQTLRCPFPSNGFINKIKNPLLKKGIDMDVALCVYDNSKEHLDYIEKLFKPILISTSSPYNSSQIDQFMFTLNKVSSVYDEYDRIIFLRLDSNPKNPS